MNIILTPPAQRPRYLTPRQWQVVEAFAGRERTARAVAAELGVTPSRVAELVRAINDRMEYFADICPCCGGTGKRAAGDGSATLRTELLTADPGNDQGQGGA